MDKKTGGIIATIVAVLLCGCPGLCLVKSSMANDILTVNIIIQNIPMRFPHYIIS